MKTIDVFTLFTEKTPLSEFLTGARDVLPLVIGSIPAGIAFGTLAQISGLSFAATMAMSALVFAAAAQFIALGLLSTGTGWFVIVMTIWLVNLRHLMYSFSLLPYVRNLRQIWKISLAFTLTDEAFAVAINRYYAADESPYKRWYHLGAATLDYVSWQLFTLLGLTVGKLIPGVAGLGLDFVMSATFIGIVVPSLRSQPIALAVFVSGVVSLLTSSMIHKIGLIVAVLSGVITGIYSEVMGARAKA